MFHTTREVGLCSTPHPRDEVGDDGQQRVRERRAGLRVAPLGVVLEERTHLREWRRRGWHCRSAEAGLGRSAEAGLARARGARVREGRSHHRQVDLEQSLPLQLTTTRLVVDAVPISVAVAAIAGNAADSNAVAADADAFAATLAGAAAALGRQAEVLAEHGQVDGRLAVRTAHVGRP